MAVPPRMVDARADIGRRGDTSSRLKCCSASDSHRLRVAHCGLLPSVRVDDRTQSFAANNHPENVYWDLVANLHPLRAIKRRHRQNLNRLAARYLGHRTSGS